MTATDASSIDVTVEASPAAAALPTERELQTLRRSASPPPRSRPPSKAMRAARSTGPPRPPTAAHQQAAAAAAATGESGGGDVGEASCFICMESHAPLLVGKACGCSNLAVHECCLERWINYGEHAGAQQFDERLVCSICKEKYRLHYEVISAPPVPQLTRVQLLKRFVAGACWAGLGAGLATLCYGMQVSEAEEDAAYHVAMAALCIYVVITVGAYVYCVHRAENSQAERERSATPTLHFTSVAVDEGGGAVRSGVTADNAAQAASNAVQAASNAHAGAGVMSSSRTPRISRTAEPV